MPGELKSRDLRSPEAQATAARLRRFYACKAALISDLGHEPSAAEKILAHNAGSLAIFIEELVKKKMDGEAIDVGEMQSMINTLRRQLESLGIQRRAKDVLGDLSTYIESKNITATNGTGS